MKLVEESFLVAIEFAIKVQRKGLNYMFCFLMSPYKIFKEGALSLDFILKIICHLG